MATALKLKDLDVTLTGLMSSAALGGEAGDDIASGWTALGNCQAWGVLVYATNIVNTQVLTLTVQTATDSSGTGAATRTGMAGSVATATGTATATDQFELAFLWDGGLPAGTTHFQATLATDDADGAEVVAAFLFRKLNS